MQATDKIIAALDVDDLDTALKFVKSLSPHVGAFKIGLEIMNSAGTPQVVSSLQSNGAKIFLDGKFHDIPNTVAKTVRSISRLGIWMLNVHCLGGRKMMEEAVSAAVSATKTSTVKKPLIVGVTILTSLDSKSANEVGMKIRNAEELRENVVRLAMIAKSSGLDGVVASPMETSEIKMACGKDFLVVTPGVRPVWADEGDQKRMMTPRTALDNGADYLVIGRPITDPPKEIGTPIEAAKKIADEIKDYE